MAFQELSHLLNHAKAMARQGNSATADAVQLQSCLTTIQCSQRTGKQIEYLIHG